MLLNIGADSTIGCAEDEGEDNKGVLNSISWKLGSWMTGEYDVANMFVAYYEMVDRAQKGKQYTGIRAFRDSVGEVVSKVEKMKVHSSDDDSERTSYLILCGEKHLIVSDYAELIINPYVREEAIEVEDVTEQYQCLIGAKIKGLRYLNNSLAKLNFDNGLSMMVGFNDSAGINEPGSWVKIIRSAQTKLPEIRTGIESIKLWGSLEHAEDSTFYRENTIVLNTENVAYALYAHSTKHGNLLVRVQKIEKGLVAGLNRGIDVHNLVLKHIEYVGIAIKWISFECDEGILYVVTDGFTDVVLFLSETDVEPEVVTHVGFYTKGLKKIKFVYEKRGISCER